MHNIACMLKDHKRTESPSHRLGYGSHFDMSKTNRAFVRVCLCVYAGKEFIVCKRKSILLLKSIDTSAFLYYAQNVVDDDCSVLLLSFVDLQNAMQCNVCECLSNCCAEPKLCGNICCVCLFVCCCKNKKHIAQQTERESALFSFCLCANTDEIGAFFHQLPWRTRINRRRRHHHLRLRFSFLRTNEYMYRNIPHTVSNEQTHNTSHLFSINSNYAYEYGILCL